jgi:hypothetical protein
MHRCEARLALLVSSLVCALNCPPARGAVLDLAGIDYATGRIYRLPTDGSEPSLVAQTGVQTLGSFELLLDGNYYGITHDDPTLYRFDPVTFAPTALGRVTFTTSMFEGAIAQSPDGTVYLTNGGTASTAQLLTLDLSTRVATAVGRLRQSGDADVNGLAWRGDGQLVALDRGAGGLVIIDPDTGAETMLQPLPFAIGAVGGMTLAGNVGYFVTGGPGSVVPGNNSLYSFDPFTGQATLIRSLANLTTAGEGFGGLAVLVPEPAALATVPPALLLLARRGRPRAAGASRPG